MRHGPFTGAVPDGAPIREHEQVVKQVIDLQARCRDSLSEAVKGSQGHAQEDRARARVCVCTRGRGIAAGSSPMDARQMQRALQQSGAACTTGEQRCVSHTAPATLPSTSAPPPPASTPIHTSGSGCSSATTTVTLKTEA